ncbi:MAG: cellulase family glycosylhydrolase [Cytophagales bacterium]|jgi:hypothetical protein|nr:cellulase family glycosylhydrolase [Cytophagales bacterium]
MKTLFTGFLLLLFAVSVHAQTFRVQGTQIIGPDGKEFIIKGVNVNGPHWPWNRPTVPDADLIANVWKFNTVRVNIFPSLAANGCCINNNTDLDAIVNAFASRKLVVQLENHDFTCKYPNAGELATLRTWWVNLANKYKNNPYVWFNIMNEPGSGNTVTDEWKTVHEEVVRAIRQTGAENIIVLDGFACGQENGYKRGEAGSGILTHGPYFVQNYTNIAFSLHLYADWIYGRQRLADYIDAVRAKNLSLHIGEYGSGVDYSGQVAADVIRVCNEKNIGRMVWQWTGVDIHRLTNGSGGFAIDRTDGSKPTNLSFAGNLIWNDNRSQLTEADYRFNGTWLVNGSFESGLDGWINFGQAAVETTPANVNTGRQALRVNAGSQSGAGQPLYLLPDTTYVLSAWGRNSAAPPSPSTVGFNIKGIGIPDRTISIGFTETAYTYKTLEFRTPRQPTETFLFVYKNEAAPAFYVDDIDVQLKGQVTAVENPQAFRLAAYPNPATGTLFVALPDSRPVRQAWLCNLVGYIQHLSFEKTDERTLKLNVQAVPPGVYVLYVRTDAGVLRTKVSVVR